MSDDSEQLTEWKREQLHLQQKCILHDDPSLIQEINKPTFLLGGVDISFVKNDPKQACACCVIMEFPTFEVLRTELKMITIEAPYVPNYLAFREAPPLADLVRDLISRFPDLHPALIMVDGNGTLHRGKFGLACHLGVLLDMPTVGVAKNYLHINEEDECSRESFNKKTKGELVSAGDKMDIFGLDGSAYGRAVRSVPAAEKPIFISPGHRISLDTAVDLVLRCCKYRLPEPTRQADIKSREFLREHVDTDS